MPGPLDGGRANGDLRLLRKIRNIIGKYTKQLDNADSFTVCVLGVCWDCLKKSRSKKFVVTALEFSDYKGEQHWEHIHFVLPSPEKEDDFLKSHSGTEHLATATYYRTESSDKPIILAS